MKTKSPSQTAGPLGKDHKWVGHFRKHLDAGHNDGPRIRDDILPKRGTPYYPVGPMHDARTDEGDPVFFGESEREAKIGVQGGPKRGTRIYAPPPHKKYGGTGEI